MVICIDSNIAEDLISRGHDWRIVLMLWTLAHEALQKDPPTQIAKHCKTARKTTESESNLRKSFDQKKKKKIQTPSCSGLKHGIKFPTRGS